ncbi:MAG: hypothetical protein IPN94_00120 [Sphingobacteriales bacterium]|nr:hypothetical protein [Sphingobacteriales bacterium]
MAVADTSLLNNADAAPNAKITTSRYRFLRLCQLISQDVEVIYKTGLVYAYQKKNSPKAIKCFNLNHIAQPQSCQIVWQRGLCLYFCSVAPKPKPTCESRRTRTQNAKFHHNLGAFLTDENTPEACEELKKARDLGYNDPKKFLEQKCK